MAPAPRKLGANVQNGWARRLHRSNHCGRVSIEEHVVRGTINLIRENGRVALPITNPV
jgi:hypothetical protein